MGSALAALASALQRDVANVVVYERLDSTHAAALRLIEQMDQESIELAPTLLVALSQKRGVGRGKRRWSSPQGGLYASWVASGVAPELVASVPILAAAAAHAALSGFGVAGLGIKWPNDLVVAGAKIAGLLVHARHGDPTWVTAGLGVNLTTTPPIEDDPRRSATSLADQTGAVDWPAAAREILARFARELVASLADRGPALERWREHLVHSVGDELEVRLGGERHQRGLFEGLTEEGHLRLRCGEEVLVISSGELVDRE